MCCNEEDLCRHEAMVSISQRNARRRRMRLHVSVDTRNPLRHNRALLSKRCDTMTVRSSSLRVLLCADSDLHAQIESELKPATVTAVKDLPAAIRIAHKAEFDVVLLETRRGHAHDLEEVHRVVDPTRTLILAGPRAALQKASGMVRSLGSSRSAGTGNGLCLEDYVESKLGVFFKDMKNGAARNLHPILVKAVERPLITLVLKETNGNQVLAAHVLGLNRNTLRKKITELRIPVKRDKSSKVNASARP